MPKKRASALLRALSWLAFHVLGTLVALAGIPRPDVIITPSPPLTIGVNAWLIGLFHRCPFIYNVQEIYPDAAISLGALSQPSLIRLLYRLEAFVYNRAAAVTVIASHMHRRLVKKGAPATKLMVIPNFADIDELGPLPKKDNEFSRHHGMHHKFVVSYAGNMGPAQDLETFIEAAAVLRNEESIYFMMMGDGILREKLRQHVTDKGLKNFLFLPYQPYSMMPQIYATSDLSLVPQAPGTFDIAVPSKVYRIMACARPVLASTVIPSDLADLIHASGGGILVEPSNPQRLARAIRQASQNQGLLAEMGRRGRAHIAAHCTRGIVAKAYHELIKSVVQRRASR